MALTRNELLELILDLVGINEQDDLASGGIILPSTDAVTNSGDNSYTMPSEYNRILEVVSILGTATLDAGTNTFSGTGTSAETVTVSQNKRWRLYGAVWLELS